MTDQTPIGAGLSSLCPDSANEREREDLEAVLCTERASLASSRFFATIRGMKRHDLTRWYAALLMTAVLGVMAAQSSAEAPGTLTVMTYNLKYASPNPPNSWPERRPLMKEVIGMVAPDVLGTQEGLYSQLQDMAADLPGYQWIGLGRDGGSRGEFMAVFYRRARLEPLAFDHFWLSDTPEVMGSKTWGPKLPRMVTWVKFRDRETKGEFIFMNTHFDHQVQEAREKSARLVRERAGRLDPALPLLLVGDFNANAGANKAYDILTGDQFFSDTWTKAREQRNGEFGSLNGFKGLQKGGPRIDWILSRGEVETDRAEILTFAREGQFPSDHCPVVAKLRPGSGKR